MIKYFLTACYIFLLCLCTNAQANSNYSRELSESLFSTQGFMNKREFKTEYGKKLIEEGRFKCDVVAPKAKEGFVQRFETLTNGDISAEDLEINHTWGWKKHWVGFKIYRYWCDVKVSLRKENYVLKQVFSPKMYMSKDKCQDFANDYIRYIPNVVIARYDTGFDGGGVSMQRPWCSVETITLEKL